MCNDGSRKSRADSFCCCNCDRFIIRYSYIYCINHEVFFYNTLVSTFSCHNNRCCSRFCVIFITYFIVCTFCQGHCLCIFGCFVSNNRFRCECTSGVIKAAVFQCHGCIVTVNFLCNVAYPYFCCRHIFIYFCCRLSYG